jgi:MFS family permease
MFSALKHRNFRLYLAGQSVSLIGTWMQQLATSWLVYRMTSSPLWLGISTFSTQIPMFVFGLFGGVYVDRVNRHRLLFWTQALAAVQALILAVLALYGVLNLAEIIGLNLVLGIVNAVDMPARQAFVVELVDRRDLSNAIALNSSVMNGTRLVGPAIAGLTIGIFGEGACFLLNALSYVAVLVALGLMVVTPRKLKASKDNVWESLKDGFSATFGNPSIRVILSLIAFMSMFGMPYMTLFPALAAKVPGGGAHTLGWIASTGGLGALVGSIYLARKGSALLGRVIGVSSLTFGLFVILLSQAHAFGWMLACVFFTGLGIMLQASAGNTVIQTLVEDEKRGRVMSFFSFSILGIAPFGSLLIGAAAQKLGLESTLLLSGVLCVAGALVFMQKAKGINQRVSEKDRSIPSRGSE